MGGNADIKCHIDQREPGKNSHAGGLTLDSVPESAFANAFGDTVDGVSNGNASQNGLIAPELKAEDAYPSNLSYHGDYSNEAFYNDQEFENAFPIAGSLELNVAMHQLEFQPHWTLGNFRHLSPDHAIQAPLEASLTGPQEMLENQVEFEQFMGFDREFDGFDDQDFDYELRNANVFNAKEVAFKKERVHDGAVETDICVPNDTTTNIGDPLEYAYSNDLITDHRPVSFSLSHLFSTFVLSTLHPANEDVFPSFDHLVELEIPTIVVTGNVKTIETNQEAVKLISEARCHLSDSELKQLSQTISQSPTGGPTWLEPPLLRSDNAWDLSQYHREISHLHTSLIESIKNHNLPLDIPDNEKGEGVEPSSQVRQNCEIIWRKMEAGERLVVTRESLTYLAGQIKDDYEKVDLVNYLISGIQYTNDMGLHEITPPASPKLGQNQSTPKFEHGILHLPSDSMVSTLSDNLHAIEDEMLKDLQEAWSETTSPIRQSIEEELSITQPATFIKLTAKKLEDLKLEVPLMSGTHSGQKPPPSGVATLQGFIKEASLGTDSDFERTLIDGSWIDTFKCRAQKEADSVIRCIEQEQLKAVDAIGRVPIPILDFSIPEAEWKRLRSNPNSIFKWIGEGNEPFFKLPTWPRDRKAESKMIWRPLTPSARCALDSDNMNDGECYVQKLLRLSALSDVPSSLDFVAQRKKLAILDLDDGDEEIEAQLPNRQRATDTSDLVKKRPLHVGYKISPKKKPRRDLEQTTLDQLIKSPSAGTSLLAGDSPGASSKLLSNFLDIHAPKKKSWTGSKYFASVQGSSSRPETLRFESKGVRSSQKAPKEAQSEMVQQPVARTPCPQVKPPVGPVRIFISITVPRRMLRALESMVPGLAIIERDYDAHNTYIWRGPGSVSRTEMVPPLANDADISVSPSTGIIITSMIKIRQRPRADEAKNAEQIRLEKASLRYENLIVLVGEAGDHCTLSEMTASDATALTELQGFATGLECNVQVLFAGGGYKTLWQWIAACICRHSLAQPLLLEGLLEVETLWELFLRRAGFNVFAAQVVASQLKSSVSCGNGSANLAASNTQGLSAFVTMTRAERMRRFGALVGPRVLDRVSEIVDELWNVT